MMRRALRRFIGQAEGGALVELAVSLPILVVILAGTVDFARVFNFSIAMTNAARAGAQWGAASTGNAYGFATMKAKAEGATNYPPGAITATASRLCMCADDAGNFSDTSPTNTCTAVCPSSGHIVMTVTVTATGSFSTIMGVLPGISGSFPLSRSATMRVAN